MTKAGKRRRANDSASSSASNTTCEKLAVKPPLTSTPSLSEENKWSDTGDESSNLHSDPEDPIRMEAEYFGHLLEQQLEVAEVETVEKRQQSQTPATTTRTGRTKKKKGPIAGMRRTAVMGRGLPTRESLLRNQPTATKKMGGRANPAKKTKLEVKAVKTVVEAIQTDVVSDKNEVNSVTLHVDTAVNTAAIISHAPVINNIELSSELEITQGSQERRGEVMEVEIEQAPTPSGPEITRKLSNKSSAVYNGGEGVQPSARRWTDIPAEKRGDIINILNRTVYIKSSGRQLHNYFQRQPYKLQKEITQAGGGEVERIQVAGESLKVVAYSEGQKVKLMQLTSIDGKPVQTSLPLAVTKWQERQAGPIPHDRTNDKFGPRGVVHGLQESDENLMKIATSHGLKSLKKIGNLTSKTTLVTFEPGTQLPTHMYIEGWQYKIWPYIPRPRRCDNCQAFDHATQSCTETTTCSKCSGPHPFLECPNKENPKCANCKQAHSAAYKNCAAYIEHQKDIKTKVEQRALYSDMARKAKATVPTQKIAETLPHYQNETVTEFLNFDKSRYQARTVPTNMGPVDHPDTTRMKTTTFVLGVIALLGGNKPVTEMQKIVAQTSSEILYNGSVTFEYDRQIG